MIGLAAELVVGGTSGRHEAKRDTTVDEVVDVVRETYDNSDWLENRDGWSHEMAGKLMDGNEVNSKIFDGKKGGWQP